MKAKVVFSVDIQDGRLDFMDSGVTLVRTGSAEDGLMHSWWCWDEKQAKILASFSSDFSTWGEFGEQVQSAYRAHLAKLTLGD
jgi:hypothetical protein